MGDGTPRDLSGSGQDVAGLHPNRMQPLPEPIAAMIQGSINKLLVEVRHKHGAALAGKPSVVISSP
jgi:hypothetical protein